MDFLDIVLYKSSGSNFTEIHLGGTSLIWADRRTEMVKLVGAFRDYAKVPKHAEVPGSKYLPTDGGLDLTFPC